jgi:hypothetical protein
MRKEIQVDQPILILNLSKYLLNKWLLESLYTQSSFLNGLLTPSTSKTNSVVLVFRLRSQYRSDTLA